MDDFENYAAEEGDVNVYLEECQSCGRKFNFDALERHSKICSSLKKRKPFDAKKQRLLGIGVEKVQKQPEPKKIPQQQKASGSRKGDWRRKHEEFISTIRNARGVTVAVKNGQPLPPPPPATVDPDYVQCPHCERNFNEHAAERHMPFCKEQKARKAYSNKGPSVAREKQNKRLQYRPPLPGRRDTGNSDINSPIKPKSGGSADLHKRYPSTENLRPTRLISKATSAPAKSNRTAPVILGSRTPGKVGHSPQEAHVISPGDRSKQRASSGSSTSDSEYSSRKPINKKEPQWYEDMMKSKAQSSPQEIKRTQQTDSRQESDRGFIDDDVINDRKPHSGRRRAEHTRSNQETSPMDGRQTATVGVVRPSSRHAMSPSIQSQEMDYNTPSMGRGKLAKFCHECGTRYPVESAKFCCECGLRRVHINS